MNVPHKARVLSLGAGVQSSTMALMAAHGEIERPDFAVFADTQAEPRKVYEWLDWLEQQLPFPIYRATAGNLTTSLIRKATMKPGEIGRFSSVPFFMSSGGIGKRQCTKEFKLAPILRKTREALGYQPRQRIPFSSVEMLIGISLDEAHRMKPSFNRWCVNRWPLIEKRLTRGHCLEWMAKNGYPKPPKSSCKYCPYHSDQQWLEIKNESPDEWAEIVALDKIIRNGGRGLRDKQFMHRSLRPIDEVEFYDANEETVDMFGNECEGICGI